MDTITLEGSQYEQAGGSGCYCSITAREFKFDVDLYTKFGTDFPHRYLTERKISIPSADTATPSTRFSINITGSDRTLKIENRCDDIDYVKTSTDGTIISPICNEISASVFSRIRADSEFVLVDPQGFLRTQDSQKNVLLRNVDLDLSGVGAIKVNPDEGRHLTGNSGDAMMKSLQKQGIDHVILTDKTAVSMLAGDKIYSITLPNKQVYDTTGVGDIFCAAFCCTMLREKDFLWALCFAGGAAQAALDSGQIGLLKIPTRGQAETNASYFYNLIKFRTVT